MPDFSSYEPGQPCWVDLMSPDIDASKAFGEVGAAHKLVEGSRHPFMHSTDTILDAADAYAPHQLATYALELARHFHRFYETNPVLTSTGVQKAYRLWVIGQVQQTLQRVLGILGISSPTRM